MRKKFSYTDMVLIRDKYTRRRTGFFLFSVIVFLGLNLTGCGGPIQRLQTSHHIDFPKNLEKRNRNILLVMEKKDVGCVLKGKACMLCDRILIDAGKSVRTNLLFYLWNIFDTCGFDHDIPKDITYDYVLKVDIEDAHIELGRTRWNSNRIHLKISYVLYDSARNLLFSIQPETTGIGKPDGTEATVAPPPAGTNPRNGIDLFHKSLGIAWNNSLSKSIDLLREEFDTRRL